MNQTEAPPQQPAAPPHRAARPLVLVGMMGCGKTTVGRRLAQRLSLPFVDADAEIETAAAMPISEMFERFGEAHFRDGERRVIARLLESGPMVIATGGGAFTDPDTRARILRSATAIWLDAEIDTLVQRVSKRGGRPLLAGRDARQVLTELMEKRRPAYSQAPIRVRSGNCPHDYTVDAIVHALAAHDGAEHGMAG